MSEEKKTFKRYPIYVDENTPENLTEEERGRLALGRAIKYGDYTKRNIEAARHGSRKRVLKNRPNQT